MEEVKFLPRFDSFPKQEDLPLKMETTVMEIKDVLPKTFCEEWKIETENIDFGVDVEDIKYNQIICNPIKMESDGTVGEFEEKSEIVFDDWKIKNEEIDLKEENLEQTRIICSSYGAQHYQLRLETCIMEWFRNSNRRLKRKEVNNCKSSTGIGPEKLDPVRDICVLPKKEEGSLNQDLLQHEKCEEVKIWRCNYKRIDRDYFRKNYHQNGEEINLSKFTQCKYQTLQKNNLRRHILGQHKNIGDSGTFNLELGDYQTVMDVDDSDKFKCNLCEHKTLLKGNLKQHILRRHKNIDEINTFNCNLCNFQTYYRSRINEHLLRHKNIEEVDAADKFKCDECSYVTLRKRDLQRHILQRHKNRDEIVSFKCMYCEFRTIYKAHLKAHLLRHKNIEEVHAADKFVCTLCGYQTLQKISLKEHMLTHKTIDETDTFNCNLCNFRTYLRSQFKTHLLRHKNIEEVDASDKFVCSQCKYVTLRKGCLKNHMLLRHKNRDELEKFKCIHCEFRTIYKKHLKTHLLRHINIEDVDDLSKFKCDQCAYITLKKGNLKSHILLRHKNINEFETFNCDHCDYRARRKSSIKKHLQKHKKEA